MLPFLIENINQFLGLMNLTVTSIYETCGVPENGFVYVWDEKLQNLHGKFRITVSHDSIVIQMDPHQSIIFSHNFT